MSTLPTLRILHLIIGLQRCPSFIVIAKSEVPRHIGVPGNSTLTQVCARAWMCITGQIEAIARLLAAGASSRAWDFEGGWYFIFHWAAAKPRALSCREYAMAVWCAGERMTSAHTCAMHMHTHMLPPPPRHFRERRCLSSNVSAESEQVHNNVYGSNMVSIEGFTAFDIFRARMKTIVSPWAAVPSKHEGGGADSDSEQHPDDDINTRFAAIISN